MADLMRQDAEIERPSAAFQPRDIGAERRRFAKRVGRLMENATKALDERIGELALEEGGKIGVLRTAGADRAAQQTAGLARQLLDMLRLGLDIRLVDIDFHMQARRQCRSAAPRRCSARSEIPAADTARPRSRDNAGCRDRRDADGCR